MSERNPMPQRPTTEASVSADKYDQMLTLADLFDATGNELRGRARLGTEIAHDPDIAASEPLSRATFRQAEDDIRAATTGKQGLLTRSVELDADALVVRATVLTYRWIDELQQAAYETLGSIAGRAIGYLAPEVALGGAIVGAGLIETDALDRDGVASYLNELAEQNPELLDHLSGGGGLLEGMHMRSLLTAGVLASDKGALAARGGLAAIGVPPFQAESLAALRDAASALIDTSPEEPPVEAQPGRTPRSLTDLVARVTDEHHRISVEHVGEGRWIAYLPSQLTANGDTVRLVAADPAAQCDQVLEAIETAIEQGSSVNGTSPETPPRLLLVGDGAGGVLAAEIAANASSPRFTIDQVVTIGAPSAQVPRIPAEIRVLSLEDRSDPVALLGSLINAAEPHRVTVVFDGSGNSEEQVYVAGARAADQADHPGLRAEVQRLRDLGFLA